MKAGTLPIAACAFAFVIAGSPLRPPSPAAAAAPAPGPVPVASVQEIMKSEVAPAADVVWKAVGSIDGKDVKPETDEEWARIRDAALLLVEAPNLLITPGRQVVHAGVKLEDEGQDGNLTSAEMQKRIAANPAAFAGYALGLQKAALSALAAIDKRDLDGIVETGGQIDEACEACHTQYWYPGAAQ